MVLDQTRSRRKETGSRYKRMHAKKKHALGRAPTLPRVGETKAKSIRVRGGNFKNRLLFANTANVLDPKTKKYSKAKIKVVLENPANRHYVRRNILTKGTIIETDKGKARILSRPAQDGTINAVLV